MRAGGHVLELEVQDRAPVARRVEVAVEAVEEGAAHVQHHAAADVDHLRRRHWKPPVVGRRVRAGRSRSCETLNCRSSRRAGTRSRVSPPGSFAQRALTLPITHDTPEVPRCSRPASPRSCSLPLSPRSRRSPRPRADGPKDNLPDNVRPVPPVGNDIPAEDRDEIKKGLAELQQLIKDIGKHDLLPDVQIYEKAVRWALDYKEIYDGKGAKPAANVKKVLAAGPRAREGAEGRQDAVDDADRLRAARVQVEDRRQRATVLAHRAEGVRLRGEDEAPARLLVARSLREHWRGRASWPTRPARAASSPRRARSSCTPMGRYCNANKFAGEIDTFECLDHAKKHYRIDEIAAGRPRVQHGRGRVLAVRAPTTRRCGPRAPRAPASARRRSS